MTKNSTPLKTTFSHVKQLMALTLFFYLQYLLIQPVNAQNPVVTNSATYDVFMNLDPSRGINPTTFATDVSNYLDDLGAASGSYHITTSAVTLDPTDVAKWEVFDHYDVAWYANQTAWSASPDGFNNGNIPSNWYFYSCSDNYNSKLTIKNLLDGSGTWLKANRLQSHIYPYVENGKPAMQFYGYSSIAAADFLYYPADVASTKTVKFDIDATNVITHSMNSAGFLINGGTTGTSTSKTISGYLLLFTWPAGLSTPATSLSSVKIYKLDNVNVDNLHNSGTGALTTLVATSSFSTFYTKSHIELSITSTSITATIQQLDGSGNLTGSKSTMFNSQTLTNTSFGGFGPFVLYSGHGCDNTSAFRYSNLEMAFGGVLSGNSSLEPYKFAEYLNNSTKRFFVNLTNTSQTNYGGSSNEMDNAYLTKIEDDKVICITDESAGTYLPGTLNQNIKDVTSEPTDATLAAALPLLNLGTLTDAQKLALKTAYLIFNTPLGSYGTIPVPSTTAVASLSLMDGPGTDASWTGANQVNEIKSWLVGGTSIDIYLKSDNSVNADGLTATYKLKDPIGTITTITTSTDVDGKLHFALPKTSTTGDYSVTLSYATGGTITTTVPYTSTFKYDPIPQIDGSPSISGTMQYGQTLTLTPNITSVPGITGTLSYQWKANGTNISGATGSTYILTASEVGKTISCDITSNAQPGTKSATITGSVSKITLSSATVTAVTSKTYNGTTATTGGTITFSGTVNSESPTYNATIVWTSANAGTGTVNVSGVSLTNMTDRYTLSAISLNNVTPGNNATITQAPLTVTGSSVTSKAYDGTASATISGATLSGKVGSDDVSLGNSSSGTFNNANVGTGKSVTTTMIISGSASGNYSLTQPTLTGNITAKSVTITGVTAASKPYDGLTTAILSGGSVSAGVGIETLAITSGTGAFADKNVGTKTVTASGYSLANGTNGGLASNYNLSAQPVIPNQSITAKPVTITGVTAASKPYDGSAAAALSGGSVTTGVGSETLAITAGTGVFADKNVGTKAVTASGYALANGTNGGLASNYSLSAQPVIANQSITPKSVSITGVTASNKVYDGLTTAALSGGSVSTGVGTETLAITAGIGAFADKNVGTKAVTASGYALADGTNGGLASNYALSAQPTVANKSITAKSVTITGVAASSKIYDGSNTATLSDGSVSTGVETETLSIIAGSGTFADKNVGTKAVTASGFSLADGTNGGLASNYSLSAQPVIANQSITAKPVTITGVTATSKVYDGSVTATLSGGSVTTGVGSETLTIIAGSGTFADKNVGTKAVTAVAYSLANGTNGGLAANYSLSAQPVIPDQSITAKSIAVSAETKSKVYGETDPVLTYTFSPALIGSDAFSGALSRTTGENVGAFAINQNDLALSSNYDMVYTSADLTITPKPIAVTADIKSKVYGESDPALTYTFTPDLVEGDAFTGALRRTAGENVGDYAIDQNDLALSSNYTLNYTSADLSITVKPIALSAEIKTKVYGEADPALTFTFSPELVEGDVFTGSLRRTVGENVGDYSINQNDLALSSNYDLNYTSADLSITAKPIAVTADIKSKVYGESDPALTYTFTPDLVEGDAFTGALSRTAGENAGSYAINSNDLALSSNYSMSYTPADLTINKATLTVTAESKQKVYGTANPALTFQYSGWKNVDDAADLTTQPSVSSIVTLTSPVAVYNDGINVSGGADENYDFSYVPAAFEVTKATLTVTADQQTKIYGNSNPELTFTFAGWKNNDNTDDLTTLPSASTIVNLSSPVNNYSDAISISGGVDDNYEFAYVPADFDVTRATLTVTAVSKTKIYGEENPPLTITYSGFVNNDGASDLSTLPAITVNADHSSAVGVYPLLLSGATGDNYEIEYVQGTLTVNKAPLTISAENRTTVYLGEIPELTATYKGFVNGDNKSVLDEVPTISTLAMTGSDAGTYDIMLTGGSDNNYRYILVDADLTINKADQTIEFTGIPAGLRATQEHQLVATSTSGLTVEFESADPTIVSVAGSSLTVKKEGSVTITATQEGNNNWNPAVAVSKNILTLPSFDNLVSLFTPNGDGMNDTWYIPGIENYGQIAVKIYNRYGKLVYESADYKNDWNGTFNGNQLPEASYYYVIKSSVRGVITGAVNIIR